MSKRPSKPRDGGDEKARNRADAVADAVAREAARLLAQHKATDMAEALRLANAAVDRGHHHPPSANRVRQHAQAMSMQAMGEAAYRAQHARWLAIAEELMTTIEQALPGARTLLVGRAAAAKGGHFDADPALHIRVYTRIAISDVARTLATFGCDDPEMKFPTLEGRHGRLSQMQWIEEGLRITLTRCPRQSMFDDPNDFFTGKPLPRMTVTQLRRSISG